MHELEDRWVNKLHPLSRDAEADDPYELTAEVVVGDPDVMLECLLQEFIWMGWGRQELLSLFYDPGYPMLCELRAFFGDEGVAQRVDGLLARTGHLQFHAVVAEPDEDIDHDHGPELLQIMPHPVR